MNNILKDNWLLGLISTGIACAFGWGAWGAVTVWWAL